MLQRMVKEDPDGRASLKGFKGTKVAKVVKVKDGAGWADMVTIVI